MSTMGKRKPTSYATGSKSHDDIQVKNLKQIR